MSQLGLGLLGWLRRPAWLVCLGEVWELVIFAYTENLHSVEVTVVVHGEDVLILHANAVYTLYLLVSY
jgi:hypothetical protein